MDSEKNLETKEEFLNNLEKFATQLKGYAMTEDNQWTIKGFIDIFKNIYSISNDTKVVSKIIEMHLFPLFYDFAERNHYDLILADHQNYYPDLSFVLKNDDSIKFAVDLKTTYRIPDCPSFCNKFTLGSHGTYFIDRNSTKNIQFPYNKYMGHFCLGIIYSRAILDEDEEFKKYSLSELEKIDSSINDLIFFACEKWTIASDKQGSGNTANIGSVEYIDDILNGNGIFKHLGEKIFDEYWKNYGRMIVSDEKGNSKKLTSLKEFLKHTGRDENKIYPKRTKKKSDRV